MARDDSGIEEAVVAVAASLLEAADPTGQAAAGAPLLSGRFGEPMELGDLDPLLALGPSVLSDGPDLLGRLHEGLLDPVDRRRRGAFYTPRPVAEGVVELAISGWSGPLLEARICDPSAGGAALLLAAGRRLEAEGRGRSEVVTSNLWGVDLDPLAAAVSDAVLRLWAAEGGESVAATNVVCADGLCSGLEAWSPDTEPFDLVVGNPPFQGQLSRRTARSRSALEDLRERFGDVVRGYVDTAALFLVAALEMLRDGGRMALVEPVSFMGSRDARRTRDALLEDGTLVGLWWPGEALFEAAASVCVPVVERSGARRTSSMSVQRWTGADRSVAGPLHLDRGALRAAPTWGGLVADIRGIPLVDLESHGRLGDLAGATAGFRDQFYGLAPFVVDSPDVIGGFAPQDGPVEDDSLWPLLITSGLVDPACSLWGSVAARFAGQNYFGPRVDLARLRASDPSLAAWGEARLVPKVVVATQTSVIEAAIDVDGTWWPSVPTISVEPAVDRLWHVAAVLLAPPISALAMALYVGAAQTDRTLKLAASQVLELPLPGDLGAWDRAAEHVRTATEAAALADEEAWADALDAAGEAMCEAYGVGDEVWSWWRARRPPFRSTTPIPS